MDAAENRARMIALPAIGMTFPDGSAISCVTYDQDRSAGSAPFANVNVTLSNPT